MAMKIIFWQKHRETETKSRFLANDCLQMTANFTGSEMILKQSKNPKKRSWKNGHEKPFFAKNIEKLSSNSDFLPLTSYKIGKNLG